MKSFIALTLVACAATVAYGLNGFPIQNLMPHYVPPPPPPPPPPANNHHLLRFSGYSSETPYHHGRPGLVGGLALTHITPYTELLKDFDNMVAVLKRHLNEVTVMSRPFTDPAIQYATIMYTLHRLIVVVDQRGKEAYPIIYLPTVIEAIKEAADNPAARADVVYQTIHKVARQIPDLRHIIESTQQTSCTDHVSYICDVLVDQAVQSSPKHDVLKREISFLIELGKFAQLLISELNSNIESVAYAGGAEQYLLYGSNKLESIVFTGVDAVVAGKHVPEKHTVGPHLLFA